MNLEAIGFSATAAAAAGSAAAAVAGDSLSVKNGRDGTKIRILQVWMDVQTAGFMQFTHPSGHDTTRGVRLQTIVSEVEPMLAFGYAEPVEAQEVLAVTIAAGAVAGDIENGVFLMHYEDLPGIQAQLLTWEAVQSRMQLLTSVDLTIATGAAGGWSGAEAINAESDLLKANTDYALLGARIRTECCAVGVRSTDFGNSRVAIPGNELDSVMTANFFRDLSVAFGLATIPVFNSANKGNILVDALQDENGADVECSLILAELRS